MPDPSTQLQHLYAAGFDLQTFERFPRAVGVTRGNCIALVEATPEGLRLIGTPGWRMGGAAGGTLGVLVERDGRQVFQAKQETVEATAERLAELAGFRADLEKALLPSP
ncbi:MAG TPA: hypothetical protein VFA60_13740 [Terriglobales bacterium]|nr:hypothetical protein [Terriglobales bacterium]